MTKGRLVAVVGASGVGKDRLIDALAREVPGLHRVRRTITRDPGAGGEPFDAVTPEAFARMRDAGAFCLHWEAHGLLYGVPAEVRSRVAGGSSAVVNLSRGVLGQAAALIPRLDVIHLTAAPATLARRLGQRGREDADGVAERLGRAPPSLPEGLAVTVIANDGPFRDTLGAALAALYPERA